MDYLRGISDTLSYHIGLHHGKGLEEGIRKGRQEGILEGILAGRQEGILEGRQEGILAGRQEGRQEGILEGRQEGILEGRQEGILEGRISQMNSNMARRFGEDTAAAGAAVLADISAAVDLDAVDDLFWECSSGSEFLGRLERLRPANGRAD